MYTITDEHLEQIGVISDSIENLRSALNMRLPDSFHVSALKEALPDLAEELKSLYQEIKGSEFQGVKDK